ncbi:MAG: MerR family transcriptional regulator [Nocardioidaceae bacterium]
MRPEVPSTQPTASTISAKARLTIGDLAERTGLQPATLRTWESRHGFPVAKRRDSGHRRYGEGDVELVRQVIRRRDSGVRLEVAIAEVAMIQAAVEAPQDRPRSTRSCAADTRSYSRNG